MKHCTNCGNEILNDSAICPMCGTMQEITEQKPQKDKMNIFWFIISFLWWWVGLILFFAFRKSNPQKAKICLSGTLGAFGLAATVCLIMLFAEIITHVFAF